MGSLSLEPIDFLHSHPKTFGDNEDNHPPKGGYSPQREALHQFPFQFQSCSFFVSLLTEHKHLQWYSLPYINLWPYHPISALTFTSRQCDLKMLPHASSVELQFHFYCWILIPTFRQGLKFQILYLSAI